MSDDAGNDRPDAPVATSRARDRPEVRREPSIDDFLGRPTRDLEDWTWLWAGDHPFPIESHRGFVGRLLVGVKKLLRPLVKAPQADLWDRQRVFNQVLLGYLRDLEARRHDERIGHLENFVPRALRDLLRHNDALFARVDQRLDRHRREAQDLLRALGGALAKVEAETKAQVPGEASAAPGPETRKLARIWDEQAYLAFERRFRGSEEEIHERLRVHAESLRSVAGLGPVLDLGCGRGEALAVLSAAGLAARGIDSSAEMVARCRERGLDAEVGDLVAALAEVEEGTLGGVVSFHVVEHLPAADLDRMVRLAFRALAPGGMLILETPNPLSVLVAARGFWRDPTHQRPIHPETLELMARQAGFEPVERVGLQPFPEAERLPEIDLSQVPEEQRQLADRVNRLRDRLDEILYGDQDYAIVATRPSE